MLIHIPLIPGHFTIPPCVLLLPPCVLLVISLCAADDSQLSDGYERKKGAHAPLFILSSAIRLLM